MAPGETPRGVQEANQEKNMARTYTVSAPTTPGAAPTVQGVYHRIDAARKCAADFGGRSDLCRQDVRIDNGIGMLVEYAGPCR